MLGIACLHIFQTSKNSIILVYITLGTLGLGILLRILLLLRLSQSVNTTDFATETVLTFRVPRSIKIQPGQYVYLSFPKMGPLAAFQFHPFWIAWWHDDGRSRVLSIVIERKKGVTKLLQGNQVRPALIDGLYGFDKTVANYESIVFVGSGTGIAQQLLHLRCLLNDYGPKMLANRRILVVWAITRSMYMHFLLRTSSLRLKITKSG